MALVTEAEYLPTYERVRCVLTPATDLQPGDQLFTRAGPALIVDTIDESDDCTGGDLMVIQIRGHHKPETCLPTERIYVLL